MRVSGWARQAARSWLIVVQPHRVARSCNVRLAFLEDMVQWPWGEAGCGVCRTWYRPSPVRCHHGASAARRSHAGRGKYGTTSDGRCGLSFNDGERAWVVRIRAPETFAERCRRGREAASWTANPAPRPMARRGSTPSGARPEAVVEGYIH